MMRWIALGILGMTIAAIPFAFIARARATKSKLPRLHGWRDMDYQEKLKAQQASELFADGRAMRAPVPGTVARGELRTDTHFYEGHHGWEVDPETQKRKAQPRWSDTFPSISYTKDGEPRSMAVDEAFIRRGQERYAIYCAMCHGYSGMGDGMVHQRVTKIITSGERSDIEWTTPANYHTDQIRAQPVGQLFNTVTNGKNNMAGYRAQIPVRDRWAIVAYIKALQRSQEARRP